ncbi:coniferyl aldehyde dehydrogenase [Alteromonas sp. M12]|uniref:coniferyl aldehyde dehydrogenase n=1 Tax=Alteromonas sp. M12 TaxID=3135644 RepID=UPI00319E63C7
MNTAVKSALPSNQTESIFNLQRKSYLSDPYPKAEVRIDRISRMINLLVDHQYSLCEAVEADYGRRAVEASRMQEIMAPIAALKYARKNLTHWMKSEKRRSNFPFGLLGAKSYIKYEPLGVVGNLSPWNFPITLTLSPLGGIFAAGNRAMLKPSEYTPRTSALMADLIADYFAPDELAVIQGGADIASEFCSLPFDHLLFTGSTQVGAKILQATAPNLVPTTLELGGKSPVIIADDADIAEVAQKVAFAKTSNAGQICIAPDYVLLTNKHRQPFIDEYKKAVLRMFPDGAASPYFTNIINTNHSLRLREILIDAANAGNQVIDIFSKPIQEVDERYVAPAIIDVNNHDCRLMREEIFGPLLPIVTVENPIEALNFVQQRPKPLALYLFSHKQKLINQVTEEVACGGMVVNDLLLHFLQDDMPFGGVGPSGMGAYHGKEGFKTFSHAKSIFIAPKFDVGRFLRPPYGKLFTKLIDHEISK